MKYTLWLMPFAVILGTVFAGEKADESDAKIPAIQVVKDLDELRKQPAFDLGNFGQVRLGLEATDAPRYSGIVLYVLAENYTPPQHYNSDTLGPVQVSVTWAGDLRRIPDKIKVAFQDIQDKEPSRNYLYTRVIAVPKEEKAQLFVRNNKNELLAQAQITGTNAEFHPWSPFSRDYQRELDFDGEVAITPLSNSAEGVALPVLPRFTGLPITPETKLALPAIRRPEENKVVISLKGQNLTIKLDGKYQVSHPEEVFLARWWVNGKPFISQPEMQQCELRESPGKATEADGLRIKLELDYAKLGAKSGDKIALQILHCPEGWHYVDPEVKYLEQLRIDAKPQLCISNKIEFIAP